MAEPAPSAASVRVDMHVHTCASFDCLNTPEGILRAADRCGVRHVVITDHNRIDGALHLQRLAPERILVGEEVKTREGADIIGIFLAELIPRGTPARETCERIREQGGVVYVPHPFDTRRAGGGEILERIADLVDVVEAHNARTWKRGVNQRGEDWARSHNKLLGAGSDAHTLREIGRGFVEVPPFEMHREGFLAALAAGRVAGRNSSSPACSVFSTYAKLHKRFVPGCEFS